MIYTVTFNPSLDYIVSVDDFRLGLTNRTISERILPGGKGLNVSAVLGNLGVDSTALGFVAGFTGEEIVRLAKEQGIRTDFIVLGDGVSRINLKLKSIDGTEINGCGPWIDQAAVGRLMDKLEVLGDGDVLVLAGSIPGSMPDDVYMRILERLQGRNALAVVDATGSLLVNVLKYHPFLVKPNNYELGEIFGVELRTRREVVPYAEKMKGMGARNVLVSMAGEGAVLVAEDGCVYESPAPEGKLVNGVGAGDSMVAGFLAGWMEQGTYDHAFLMGLCAGSATAFSEGLASGAEIAAVYGRMAVRPAFEGAERKAEEGEGGRGEQAHMGFPRTDMRVYVGRSISDGIAIGKIRVYGRTEESADGKRTEDSAGEISRYRDAVLTARAQLEGLYEKTLAEAGETYAVIFKAYQMLLEDVGYRDAVEEIILTRSVSAECAVSQASEALAQGFAAMEDGYLREREGDIRDVSRRLLCILQGGEPEKPVVEEPVILVAGELSPSETVSLDRDKVLAIVTTRGSRNSHAAILSRAMGIPALFGVTGLPMDEKLDGRLAIVDGTRGRIYVDPDEETLRHMGKVGRQEAEEGERLRSLKGKGGVTVDGQRIILSANIGSLKELELALDNDAEGIGLFRSEFIYMERDTYPDEEEQFRIYRTVAEAMGGKRAVIRTMDIGADKRCGYFGIGEEENPALGYRAIRICLTRPEIFKTQLRAIFRAGAYGNLAVMYPMVTGMEEVRRIKEIVEEVKRELEEQGYAYGNLQQGIMVETPAAAVISDCLAEEVDFFSIGTNDLTQYLLAVDRQNGELEEFCDPHHPAVLRMIRTVVENAHKAGISVGICGELGADPSLTGEFLAMGVDELSASPKWLPPLRRAVRETNVSEYRKGRREF